jgi:hypothetical protein
MVNDFDLCGLVVTCDYESLFNSWEFAGVGLENGNWEAL